IILFIGCDLLLTINRYKCCYCGACVGVCPTCALELVETWLEVSADCKECGICTKICPVGALEVKA
ncbi:MAG: 4Fe-4S binding protein, partial [Methanothrix sp.]|nr:4Fe-4S binding protein [Methanothrix sp.]